MKVNSTQITMWPTILRRNEVERLDRYTRRKEKVLENKKQDTDNSRMFDFKI